MLVHPLLRRFVVMSGGHCTLPTGGPAIRLKKKTDEAQKAETVPYAVIYIRHYLLCVNTSRWVNKVATMHNHLVCANFIYSLVSVEVSVRHPTVRVNISSGADASGYYWMESSRLPPTHYLELGPRSLVTIPNIHVSLAALCCTEEKQEISIITRQINMIGIVGYCHGRPCM